MTAPHRATGSFLPDEEFVDGMIGLGASLDRGAALVESLCADDGPALVRDDHPLLLLLVGLAALHRAARSSVGHALTEAPEGVAPAAEPGGGRGLLR